jgi:cytoskeletal protein RodZ
LNLERRRRFEHCEVPAKPNDLNALQKLLFYLASSRFPPLFLWINSIYNLTPTPPPQLNDDMLFNIVLAMLGMAGLRTYEKQKGLTK